MSHNQQVVIFFGMIASGKSYLARHWVDRHGMTYHNSDVVRKEMAGLKPTANHQEEVDQGIYTSVFSRKTYDELLRRAQEDLGRSGCRGVVLDGSYQFRAERDLARTTLADWNLRFVYCHCPEPVMKARMEQRCLDPDAVSDGRWEIYLKQKERFEPADELEEGRQLITINTDRMLEALLAELDQKLRG